MSRIDAAIDPVLAAAIAASNLRDLPPEVLAEITGEARRLNVSAGSTIHREGDAATSCSC